MFKNYFLVALRNFRRHKVFSLINVTGLAIGICASLVIYLIVNYDFSFDKFEKDGDRVYRIVSNFTFADEHYNNSGTPAPMPAAVKKEVTGVELVAPFFIWNGVAKLSVNDAAKKQPTVFKNQDNIIFANEHYFNLINYEWVTGSPKTSLNNPYEIVLTESKAKLYFPGLPVASVPGNEITVNDSIHLTVTGIVKDIEANTDFNFKGFVSWTTHENTSLKPRNADRWDNTNSASQLFVKLSPGISPSNVQKQVTALYNKYRHREAEDHSTTSYALQPLADIHFNRDYDNFDQRLAHKPTLYGLLAVALFLLLLACINFINLTTAQASQRAKEIGVRKTMGSSRKQLIFQFLSETFLLTTMAAILSLLLAPFLLKVFADFIPEGLHIDFLKQPGILVFLLALTLVVSLLSGIYPALILSGYKPVMVLKNQAYQGGNKTRSSLLRKSLTISQFVVAQVFIIATILVSKQISFALQKDMGFRKDAIVNFSTSFFDTSGSKRMVLRDKLKAIPGVAMVSLSSNTPSGNATWSSTMVYNDGKKNIETDAQVKLGDTNFLKLYEMKLVAGSYLPHSDTVNSILINECYARQLGFNDPQKAIGKFIEWDGKKNPIVGVLADFNQKSVHEPIKPLILSSWTSTYHCFNVSLLPQADGMQTWKSSIAKMEKAWKEVYPDADFEYSFFDEDIAKYYTAEKNISRLLMWATGLAVFISCIGLLGLVMYVTNQRTKEIGIRKVVGASIMQIVSLLSKDFLKLIVIAFAIAVPIAWWASDKWLQNFAYKTTISWWIFFAGGLLMLFMALLILGMRTFKAASANPVKSLRSE
jgi:putative ABC transport system permease protein